MSTRSIRHVFALLAAVAAATTACGSDSSLDGYTRIGSSDSATLFAKHAPGDRMMVLVRASDGRTLCNGAGPASPERAAAICDIAADAVYIYALAIAKNSDPPKLCDGRSGELAPVQRLSAPASWSTDFLLAVRRGGGQGPIVPCS